MSHNQDKLKSLTCATTNYWVTNTHTHTHWHTRAHTPQCHILIHLFIYLCILIKTIDLVCVQEEEREGSHSYAPAVDDFRPSLELPPPFSWLPCLPDRVRFTTSLLAVVTGAILSSLAFLVPLLWERAKLWADAVRNENVHG